MREANRRRLRCAKGASGEGRTEPGLIGIGLEWVASLLFRLKARLPRKAMLIEGDRKCRQGNWKDGGEGLKIGIGWDRWVSK